MKLIINESQYKVIVEQCSEDTISFVDRIRKSLYHKFGTKIIPNKDSQYLNRLVNVMDSGKVIPLSSSPLYLNGVHDYIDWFIFYSYPDRNIYGYRNGEWCLIKGNKCVDSDLRSLRYDRLVLINFNFDKSKYTQECYKNL